ncbi:MAG TPA: sugar phosphate isomerase/epimerase family protein [Chloroflexota bacterium]|nr:sugar phosphate isomerase/epimerase family protein [Chloroflexota bacterium]
MKKGICWGCIPASSAVSSDANDPAARLREAREAGFQGVEPVIAEPGAGPLTLESTEREAATLREAAAREGMDLPSVMCGAAVSKTPVIHQDPVVRQQAVENLGKTLERAKWLGADTVLLHPGQLKPETRYDQVWEWVRDTLKAVIPHAERHGVALAIENVWNKFMLSPTEMRQLLDDVNHPLIGAYFDVGNCILYGYPEHWVAVLSGRIKKVHVKDFNRQKAQREGTAKGFCQLLDGDADYGAVMRELRATGYDGYLTSEVSVSAMPDGQGIADTARRIDQILAM